MSGAATAGPPRPGEVKIVPDAASLFRAAADEFATRARAAVKDHGRFTVALSGGSTPKSVYALLAQDYTAKRSDRLPWDSIDIFFGDERPVPPDHPDSNYRMAGEALLSKVAVPALNIHRIEGELEAHEAADRYERALRNFFELEPDGIPRFDLVLLGMGPDGHTASLFPESEALGERSRLVAANWVEKFKTFRITFTFPVLNHAAEVLFLVSGADKAPMLAEVMDRTRGIRYPAQRVAPTNGRLLWFVDAAAAAQLR